MLSPFSRPLARFPVSRLMREVVEEMEVLERSFMNPSWLRARHSAPISSTENTLINDAKKFAVTLDVSQFKPSELKVNLDGNSLKVEGNQEETTEDGSVRRSFTRQWILPSDVNLDLVTSSMNEKGVLYVEAPKKSVEDSAATRSIEIKTADTPEIKVEAKEGPNSEQST